MRRDEHVVVCDEKESELQHFKTVASSVLQHKLRGALTEETAEDTALSFSHCSPLQTVSTIKLQHHEATVWFPDTQFSDAAGKAEELQSDSLASQRVTLATQKLTPLKLTLHWGSADGRVASGVNSHSPVSVFLIGWMLYAKAYGRCCQALLEVYHWCRISGRFSLTPSVGACSFYVAS